MFFSADIENLIWQTKGLSKKVHDLNVASSGRIYIWKNNLKSFIELPFTIKILGVGLGHELDRIPGSSKMWMGSHNDFLSLLIMLGFFGLIIYLLFYIVLFNDILKSRINNNIKSFYIGILVSVIIMNFVSNSYIVRFQMAQLFWLFFGIFYAIERFKYNNNI